MTVSWLVKMNLSANWLFMTPQLHFVIWKLESEHQLIINPEWFFHQLFVKVIYCTSTFYADQETLFIQIFVGHRSHPTFILPSDTTIEKKSQFLNGLTLILFDIKQKIKQIHIVYQVFHYFL
jgi:hypothetical protein